MVDIKVETYRKMSFAFLAIVIAIVGLVYLVTYLHKALTSANPVIFWTVQNHLGITVGLIAVSVFLGYLSSSITYRQLSKTKKESRSLLDTLFLFLSREDKEIINHLMGQNGISRQAEISRLPGLNRVKAFRCLQKMKEKNIIEITANGKVRKVVLKENILRLLSGEEF